MTDLALYKDLEFTELFSIENLGDVDAGDIRIIEGYLKNNSRLQIVQIESENFDEDITLIDVPTQLEGNTWQKITIRYTPKKTREEALNTFITFWGKKRIPPE